jgi:hypothetical protein
MGFVGMGKDKLGPLLAALLVASCGSTRSTSELSTTGERPEPAGVVVSARAHGAGASSGANTVASNAKPRVPTRERLSRVTADLPRETLPNGMKRIALQHRFSHVNVATRQPNGQLKLDCVDRVDALDRLLPRREDNP